MEQQLNDDSSHYEISLTAGQAFVAFVLLLLSLAASFAFGIMVGRGQDMVGTTASTPSADTVVVEKAEPVAEPDATPALAETREAVDDFAIEPATPPVQETSRAPEPTPAAVPTPVATTTAAAPPSPAAVPHFAQLLSTGDRKTAETLAARLIDSGFTSAYVERTPGDGGTMIHRVRVRFPSEAEARAAVPRLQSFTTEQIWVTKQQ